MKPHLSIIKFIGLIVPRRLRADWRQEWEAELRYREMLLAEWERLSWQTKLDLLRRSIGAFSDALWMQTHRWEDEMIQDIRHALRMLVKQPAFTLIAIVTLALGVGANTAIFTIVNAVLLRPLPYPDSEKLMTVGRSFTTDPSVSDLSEQKFVFLRENLQSFEAITATQGMGSNVYLSDDNRTEYVRGRIATADFFRVLGVTPIVGRGFTADADSGGEDRVVILGDGLWRRRFGADPGIIGKSIALSGTNRTVIGIMPAGFEYSEPVDVLVPARINSATKNEGHNWEVIGRLKPGVTLNEVRAELSVLFDRFRDAYPRQVDGMELFGAMNWRANMTSGVEELLWILLGAVALVLLIACTNVANLQLTRASTRRKEIAIRIALGAGGGRLVRQLLTEGFALALLGGISGLLLAFWGMSSIVALVPAGMLPRAGEISVDWRVLVFAFGASLLTGILFSLAPAWQAVRVDVNRALKEAAGKASATRGRLRGTLVVVEVALALTLTVAAGLLLRTFANLRGVEPGFDARNVLTFQTAARGPKYDTVAKLNDFYARALEKLRGVPGVEIAAVTNKLPFDAWYNLPYKLAGQTEWGGATEYRLISPEYFHAMKMEVRRGRSFDETDRAGSEPVIIVNEAFAGRNFAGGEPLGQQLCVGCEYGDPALRRIVGVINEAKQRSLSERPPATIFIPMVQAAEGVRESLRQSSFVLRTSGDSSGLAAAIQHEMSEIEPTAPMRNLRPLEQLIGSSMARQRFNVSLLGSFAGLGLLLAAVGIYGVMAYSVAQRTHEIGIRMALGASARDVLGLVVGRGMALALVGVAVGLFASFGLTRLLKSLLFGVTATDPLTFVGISLLLSLIALLACYVPARRAMKVNPLTALRHE